jgi:membrane-bound serine protease (ClpP class)
LAKKQMNDAMAYIRSLAELRHRNVQWAELAVREAVSLSAEEALKQNVINLIADNTDDLLKKLNGQTVQVQLQDHVIHTSDTYTVQLQPDWRSQFLSIITDPSVAYILLLIGIYGLFFEFANPGFVMPGIAGIISLLLALYAFQLLPINYAGLSLLLIGISCIVAEVFISSFGVIGIAGIIAFVTGSILLLDTHVPGYSIAWWLILTMTLLSIGFFLLVSMLAIRSYKRPVVTGREALVNSLGEVIECHLDRVIVRVNGEIWTAQTDVILNIGQKIRVTKVSDLILTVEPTSKTETSQ